MRVDRMLGVVVIFAAGAVLSHWQTLHVGDTMMAIAAVFFGFALLDF